MDINQEVILQMKKRHEANARPEQAKPPKRVRKAAKPADKSLSDPKETQETKE